MACSSTGRAGFLPGGVSCFGGGGGGGERFGDSSSPGGGGGGGLLSSLTADIDDCFC